MTEFDRLFKKHYPKVLKHCRKLLGNREDAEDCTQKAFIRAYAVFDRYDNRPFQNWILQIATRICLDQRRYRLRRCRDVPLETLTSQMDMQGELEILDERWNPERVFMRHSLPENVTHALSFLSKPQKELLFLRVYQQMTVAEIANHCSTSESIVQLKIHRAMMKVRAQL
jgi:RNA polymerase sigma-70 factor, ECF subfamily